MRRSPRSARRDPAVRVPRRSQHDYLGEGLAEELIDTLAHEGLRVLAIGATKRFTESRDPGRIGIERSADAIVDGTVQVSRDRVRISARLVETDSGIQRWSERYDGSFQDVFALQETMGRRVAESLRLEIDAAAHRQTAPQEAIELYLRARREMRGDIAEGSGVIEKLERCIELAPTFTPALPVLAMAGVRAWWANQDARGKEAGIRARTWADRAMRDAPDIAETHLVRAMIASQDGDSAAAAQALAKTIEIAPTMPEAHCLLGELQIETGRMKRAAPRQLRSSSIHAASRLPRARAGRGARGRLRPVRRTHGQADELSHGPSMALSTARFRFALWRRDIDRARIAAAMANCSGTARAHSSRWPTSPRRREGGRHATLGRGSQLDRQRALRPRVSSDRSLAFAGAATSRSRSSPSLQTASSSTSSGCDAAPCSSHCATARSAEALDKVERRQRVEALSSQNESKIAKRLLDFPRRPGLQARRTTRDFAPSAEARRAKLSPRWQRLFFIARA
jgi:TolB-like protein